MSDKLPWSKQEFIDTVRQVQAGVDPDDVSTTESAVCIEAIARLVRGRRAAPHLEWALFNRTLRIHQALCDGRDHYVAYDVPLDDEESRTPGNQRVFKDWREETIAQGPWEDLFNIIARCAAPSRRDARGGKDLDAVYDALRRLAEPFEYNSADDVLKAVVLLLVAHASWITGKTKEQRR